MTAFVTWLLHLPGQFTLNSNKFNNVHVWEIRLAFAIGGGTQQLTLDISAVVSNKYIK